VIFVYNDACITFSLFSDTDVSQGSSATHVRCSGIVNEDFVAYLLVNLSVKKFENRSTFGEVMDNVQYFDSVVVLRGGRRDLQRLSETGGGCCLGFSAEAKIV